MTNKHGFKRNTIYNLTGSVLPLLISIVTVPVYLRLVGDDRYGVLTIVWLLLGFFGVFDFGLSRATANRIAQLREASRGEREAVFWTALSLNILFGVIGAAVFYVFGDIVLCKYFKFAASLRAEVLRTLPWMCAAVPLSIIGGVFTGALEACELFATVNSIQFLTSVLIQVVPLAVAYYHGSDLGWLIPTVIAMRAVAILPLVVCTARSLPLRGEGRPQRTHVSSLFGYGAWVTVTNLISPLLEALDRMLIGSVLSASAMSYYSVPFNLANRVRILPNALARTIFPKLSAQSEKDATELSVQVIRGLCAVLTPTIVIGIFAMTPFLRVWVGLKFASNAASVGEVILAGVWINSLAYVPFAQLQAQGRPSVVARIHLYELLPFIAFLWFLLQRFGMIGAAVAWTVRVAVDAILLFWASGLARSSVGVLFPAGLIVTLSVIVSTVLLWSSSATAVLATVLIVVSIFWSFLNEPRLGGWMEELWKHGLRLCKRARTET